MDVSIDDGEVTIMSDPQEVGSRLETLRRRRGLSREVLAARSDCSASLIKQIETGNRTLTLDKAQRFARVLGVKDLKEFYGDDVRLPLDARPAHPAVPEVRRALTDWTVNVAGYPESADYLRGTVDSAWRTWHSSGRQRSDVGALLPNLLTAAQRSVRLADPAERRTLLPWLAQAYHITQAFLAWHGERELVYLTVDRGMTAALDSDDPLAIAGSVWYAAHLLRAVGRAEEALAQLDEARDLVRTHMPAEAATTHDPGMPYSFTDWAAMMTDLWLCSAITRARVGDQSAWRDLREAQEAAGLLPRDYVHPWTRVGHVLVGVTGVMVAADLGDADQVRERAAAIDPEAIPSVDRRARHLIELARGTALEGSHEGTLALLRRAASASAETVAYTPAGRELTERVLRTSRATSRNEAEELARRIGLEPS